MFDRLTVTVQRVRFRAEEPLTLPAYKGSTFRGALGHAFRNVSCALRRQQCGTCMLRQRCAYSVCFETPVPEETEVMRKYTNAPHPFVLEPPLEDRREYEPGEELDVNLLLVGKAQEHLPHFIYAFDEMAKTGLGRERRRLSLREMDTPENGAWRKLYDGGKEELLGTPEPFDTGWINARAEKLRGHPVRIHFESPVRVKYEGRIVRTPEMTALLPNLLRRLSLLQYFFCESGFEEAVKPVLEAGETVEITDSDIQWVDWTRYSARQKKTMGLGGFTGRADYAPLPEPLLEPLCWGELLHIGKASAFGLGKYRMEVM
jgi:hypothetical protein